MFPRAWIYTGCICLLMGTAGCIRQAPDAGAKIIETLKPLQGDWEVVSLNRAGKSLDPQDVKASQASIKKDVFRFGEAKRRDSVTELTIDDFVLQIDPAKPSGEMDLVYSTGPNIGQTRRGLFALEGNTLKICWADPGQTRPTGFSAQQYPPWTLLILQRKS